MKSISLALLLAFVSAPACPILGPGAAEAFCRIAVGSSEGLGAVTATASAPFGQSFVPCQDGILTSITIDVPSASGPSHVLGLQSGTNILAPASTSVGTILPGSNRIVFNPGFPVTSGVVYSFSLTPVAGVLHMRYVPDWVYPDGAMLEIVGGSSAPQDYDLVFSLLITDAPVPVSIATWGQVKSTYR